MAKSDIRYVPAFRAGEEYERQSAEARRRQALAEALESQAYQPLSGSAAPIPSSAPLVIALQSFMSARQRRKAEEAAEKAGELETQVGKQIAGRLRGGYVYDEKALPPAEIPEQTTLEEVRPTAQYRRDVEGAMDMAMSPVGTAAMKRAPMLAAALERSIEAPKEEEFSPTVQYDDKGKAFVVSKTGNVRYLKDIQKPTEPSKPPATHGNLQWNAALGKWESIPGYKPPDPLAGDRVRSAGEDRLRREFDNATKPDLDELSQIGKVKTIFQSVPPGGKPNAIQQDVLVTLLMKFIEPGSVVREGEYDRLVSRQGLVARAQTLLNKVQTGEPLTGEALNQIAGLARLFEEAATNRIRKKAANISTLAGNRNLDINNIILEPSFLQKPIEIGSSLSGKPQGKPFWTPELQSELDALEQKMKNQPGGR